MSENSSSRRQRPWIALAAIALTVVLCAAALVFRTPLRARFWAWRLARSATLEERSIYLRALWNAGPSARWGTGALLDHEDPEVRQYGVILLQHMHDDWSRAQLLEHLRDSDPAIAQLAAVGLAMRGDDIVVPELKAMCLKGVTSEAHSACLALERLGTPAALAALEELSRAPLAADVRVAVIDALAGIADPECVPVLLQMLSDQRVCAVQPHSRRAAQQALHALRARGLAPLPTTTQAASPEPSTVGEWAAAALVSITGRDPPFSSAAAPQVRAAAERVWLEWYRDRAR
jgi:HEAT repeat protein